MKKIYKLLPLLLLCSPLGAQTFNYTGAVQTFTVPACVNNITVDVYGAEGGWNGPYAGGLGGRVQATIPVTPGEVLEIYVGQVGAGTQGSHPGVYNGGGGVFSYSSGGTSGTGGGGTDIRRTPYTTSDRLVVAGGGGGGAYQTVGGHGGGLTGQDGVPFPSWPNSGGKGGTQSSGGAQGIACCSCPTYTTPGTFAQGGNGAGDGAGGGGGGGGYYGGGGSCFGGGGGGSSYTTGSAANVTHTQGNRSGDGMVIISYTISTPSTPTNFTGSSNVCAGSTETYSINPVAAATSYTWTVPAGTTINSGQGTTSINVTFGTISGNIAVTADNTCGSSTALSQAITLQPAPVITLGPNVAQCGGSVTLDAGNAGSAFLWSDASTNQTLTVSSSGNYFVTVTGANGCSATSNTVAVTIYTPPTVTLGSDVTQCGGSVTLDADNAGSTYLWSDASTGQTLTIAASGTYYVDVTDANGCAGSDTVEVTINSIPAVAAGAANTAPCFNDGAVALNGSPSGGTWSGPGVSGNTFDPATAGAGTHVLVYTFADQLTGCSDTAEVNITVDICMGIANNAALRLSVFPNPVTDILQIRASDVLAGYAVMDVNGRVAMNGNFSGNAQQKIDVSNLPSGTYLLRATDNSGTVHTVQFVKE